MKLLAALRKSTAGFILLGSISQLSAASVIWDADGTPGGTTGGTGAWDTTASLWDNAGVMGPWVNAANNTAVFGGTVGTVTLSEPITAGGVIFNTSGYTLTGNTLTLANNATLQLNTAANVTNTISSTIGGTNWSVNALGVGPSLVNQAQGRLVIGTNTAHTGVLTINNGVVNVNDGVSLATGGGITINGSGIYHPDALTTNHPFPRLRQGILHLNGNADQIGSQMVTLNGGTVLRSSIAGGSDTSTIQNLTAGTGFNTIASAPNGGATGDTLAITNLTRNATATVEFRSTYGTLGANGDNGKVAITNLNGVAIANTNGIIGGWAYTNTVPGGTLGNGASDSFATWDGALVSLKAATPDKASNTTGGTLNSQLLSAALPADNWLANGVNANNTITTNVRINSLIEQNDVIVNNGALLTIGSGGYIMRTSNFWIQSATNDGRMTSGEANGKLFVNTAATIDALGDLRIRLRVVDNGAQAVQMIKTGNGSVRLGIYNNNASTANSYTGGTIIQGGRIIADATNAFAGGTVQVKPGGQAYLTAAGTYANNFDLSGYGAPETAGVLGAIRFNPNVVISGNITLSGDSRLHSHAAADSGRINGAITGPFGIEKSGAGSLILAGANTYSGITNVTNGTLYIAGTNNNTAINVSNNGILNAGAGAAQRGTIGVASLTYGIGTTNTVFDLGSNTGIGGANNDLITVTGALTFAGTTTLTINPVSGVLANGNYTLYQYGGGLTGAPTLNAANLNSRQILSLNTATPNVITLGVAGNAASIEWRGNVDTNWNVNTTANWDNAGVSDKFFTGDSVRFDDDAVSSTPVTVTVQGTVTPASIVVDATKEYIFAAGTSPVIAGGGSLTKSGTGALTINTPNTFSGGSILNGGSVKYGTATALGSGAVTVNNGASVDINGFTQAPTIPFTIQGAGPDGTGALKSTSATYAIVNNLTLSGDATIGGGNGRWDLGDGAAPIAINGGTFTLTKVGSNATWFRSLPTTTLGDIVVNGGVFGVENNNNALGSTSFKAIVNTGGTLSSWGGVSQNKPIQLNGGTLDNDWTGTSTWTGPINVTADSFIQEDVGGANVIRLTGNITGPGGLSKVGGGIAEFAGINTYGGPTFVNAGMLRAGSTTAFSSTSAMTVSSLLRLNGFSNSIGSLSGSGIVENGTGTATLTINQSTDTTFSGAFVDNGGTLHVVKDGPGSLTVDGSSLLTGNTDVNAGAFVVNGLHPGTTRVRNGAILRGDGNLGRLELSSGGILAPGNGPGQLDSGPLALAAGSFLNIEIGGDLPSFDYDVLTVAGDVNLGGATIDLDMLFGYTPNGDGTLFFVINNDGADAVNGTFGNTTPLILPGGTYDSVTVDGQTFGVSYTGDRDAGTFTGGNDVVLQAVVPEPASTTLLLSGLAFLAARRRRSS